QRVEEMFRLDLRMVRPLGELLRTEHGFLCFFGVLVQVHDVVRSSCASASQRSRCSGVSVLGSCASIVTYRSPRSPGLFVTDMPWPFKRSPWPLCVSGGTFKRTGRPVSVGASASPPNTDVVTGTAIFV